MERKTEQVDVRDLRTYGASRAVRHPDCDYRGNIDIHVTIRAARGDPFREDRVARLVTENVEHYCALLDYRLYGYCLMPDHLHLLLSPSENGPPLGEWLKRLRASPVESSQWRAARHLSGRDPHTTTYAAREKPQSVCWVIL